MLLSLLAAQAINIGIILNLPPPPPNIYRVSEIIQALQGATVVSRDGVPLATYHTSTPPDAFYLGRFAREASQDLQHHFNLGPADVVVSNEPVRWSLPHPPRRFGRSPRLFRQGFSRDDHILPSPFKVAIHQPDGRWLVVTPREGFPSPWQIRIFLWFVLCALALSPAAYLIARRLARPISAFAAAAERLGRDPGAAPLKLDGPLEVTQAVSAFNDMQDRLRRYVEDRTAMVGAVAHDLRTPLTRLRFRVESAPEGVRQKMTADIDQMDAMISATLAFVRDASHPGERQRLELVSLVESIADEMAETGLDVTAESSAPVVIDADPIALRRLVSNLLDNAVKFGTRARARVYIENACAVIEVDDNGPGIPAQESEQVFEPFYRGEPSRSRQTGGAGLGLAVVRSVSRAHGGDATLENRLEGGLRARARLPL
ncbi:ATP-binding protein [Caulobacter sp. S45]|uniref:ATP-binding protein n=1 Tax=Caulobacter sp. S45 TaxID=1641861 RepID=UPI003529F0D4